MAMPTQEFELELENELMGEYEGELEGEFEMEQEAVHEAHESIGEMEQEQFFNHLAAMAQRGGRSLALRRIALNAARAALRGLNEGEQEIAGELEFEQEGANEGAHELAWAAELGELEMEMLGELNPVRRVYADAQLEHMGHAAAEAETEQEAAEHFLPLIPLVAKAVLPLAAKALPALAKSAPRLLSGLFRSSRPLTRAASNVARTLYRNRTTRPLVRAVPNIARRTMVQMARRAAAGQSITPQVAVRAFARQAARTLGNPTQAVRAYRRSCALDRRFHAGAGTVIGAPRGVPAGASMAGLRASNAAGSAGASSNGRRRCTCQ